MKNLGIYIRKSRESETEQSLKEQRLLGSEFAKENDMVPIFYDDGIISGAGDSGKRLEFTKMMKDIKSGKLFGIYFWNSDRGARDEISWQKLANALRDNNCYLFDNGVKVDFKDENMMLFYTMKSGMDAYFARITAKKVKDVLNRNAKETRFGGILKYGYNREKKRGKMVVDEDEAKVVRLIFDLSLKGLGYKAIAKELNVQAIPTRYNKIGGKYKYDRNKHSGNDYSKDIIEVDKSNAKWSPQVIKNIIRSRIYIGEKIYGGNVIEVPKIITRKIFNHVQDNIDKRKNKAGKRVTNNFLLNDVLRCSKCGKRYTGRKVNKYLYYRCASRIIAGGSCGSGGIKCEILDNTIWGYLFYDEFLLNTMVEHFKNKDTCTALPDLELSKGKLEKDLNKRDKEINNVTKLLVQDIINQDEGATQLKRIRKEKDDILNNLENINEEILSLNSSNQNDEDYIQDIKSLVEDTSYLEKKNVIQKYIKEIQIEKVDEYVTVEVSFNIGIPNERMLVQDNNQVSWVDIEFDDKCRADGYLNVIDFEIKEGLFD